MRRELSSTCPLEAGQTATNGTDGHDSPSFRSLAARKLVIGTAATAALAAAAGVGVAAPAMTAAADRQAAPAAAPAAAAAATPGYNLEDLMDRTVPSGLGSAPVGGAWNTWGASFSVSGGRGHMARVAPGVGARASLDGVQVRDEGVSMTFSLPTLPTSGTGSFFGVLLRRQANGDAVYARVKVLPGGTAAISTKVQVGTTSTDIDAAAALPTRLVAGADYVLDAVATGGTATRVAARVYPVGTSAPAWQSAGTATLTGAMAAKGSVGVYIYASPTGTAFSLDVDGIRGQDASTPGTSPTSSPTSSAPTSSAPTSAAPTSSAPTSSAPTSSAPTSSAPTSSTPASSSPVSSATPTDPASIEGGIGFAGTQPPTDPTTPTTPVSTPPSTTSTPPPPPVAKPGASNTGPSDRSALRPYNGSITAATAGQVIENLEIFGSVRVIAADVTIRNCIVHGVVPTATTPVQSMIQALDPRVVNLQVVDTEIAPTVVSYKNQSGIAGHDYTLTRVNVHGSIDGITVLGSNVTMRDSWDHDTSYISSIPQQGGGFSHNDAVAVIAGTNILITGNTFEKTTQSVLQTNPNLLYGPIRNMVWSDNFIDGGACSLNIAAQQYATLDPITLTDNRFGNHQLYQGCAIIADVRRTPLVMSGNVWDANDVPVTVQRGV